jgi:hypothetical protein
MRIFITFRHADASEVAQRLRDGLSSFAYDCVMMSEERSSHPSGYPDDRAEAIAGCDAFVAVIGSRWLMRYDERGRPGLFHRDDFVRKDVATALARDVPILVALVEAVAMPQPSQLPAEILLLAYQRAVVLRSACFEADIAKLVAELRRLAPAEP